jgi:membrane protein DedA with SNARE-associated domain
MSWFVHIVRYALLRWGYLALAVGLLGESAGLPLPGETTLMLASFLSQKTTHLSIFPLILIGSAAAVLGDNLGFLLGRWLGPRMLRWFKDTLHKDEDVAVATDQIKHHGGATVFWARYIFGLRTIAGPVAGALGMNWKRFLVFNALGGVSWVMVMALIGSLFGNEFHSLFDYIEKASWAISGGIFAIGYFVWRRKKKHFHEFAGQHK